MSVDRQGQPTAPDTPPGQAPPAPNGDNGGQPRTFTQEEHRAAVDSAKRGLVSQNQALQAELDKYREDEQRRKDAELSAGERVTKLEADLAAEREARTALETWKAARLDRVKERNKERLKALPEDAQSFPLSDDPDAAAEQIARLEALSSADTRTVNVQSGPPRAPARSQDADPIKAGTQKGNAWVMGGEK